MLTFTSRSEGRPRQGPHRLIHVPLTRTCHDSVAEHVLQLVQNIHHRVVQRHFVFVVVFADKPQSTALYLADFVVTESVHSCVRHA